MWSEESEVALWQMDHWPVKDMLLVGSDSVASFRKKKHICVAMCLRAVGCQVSVMSYLYACVYGVDCGCCGWMWRWLFCWLWGGGVLILAGWCWLLSLQCWLANKFQLGGEKCVLCKETSGPTTNSLTKSSLDWSDPMYVTDPDSLVLLIDCHFPTASNFLHLIHFLFVTFELTRRNATQVIQDIKRSYCSSLEYIYFWHISISFFGSSIWHITVCFTRRRCCCICENK